MIGGKHLQQGTSRPLTYNGFFTEDGPTISVFAIIREGNRLLENPDLSFAYTPSDGLLEDAVTAHLIRYMNSTTFGEGTVIAPPPQIPELPDRRYYLSRFQAAPASGKTPGAER